MNAAEAHSTEIKSVQAMQPPAQERRRRKRAKISAQVQVKGGGGSAQTFEEICMSVDVSRDGLYFTTSREGYRKGERLQIVFPYSAAAAAINTPQFADVVRAVDLPDGRFGVAVEFQNASTATKGASQPAAAEGATNVQPIILAVEADPRQADMMRNLFSQDGYAVVIVRTAKEALEYMRSHTPSVFLAEVEAEDMSGHDLCLIIKRNPRLQTVPVILLTRSAQPADYSASHSLGAVVCMAKPFKPERLQHVVRLVSPPPRLGGSSYSPGKMNSSVERTL